MTHKWPWGIKIRLSRVGSMGLTIERENNNTLWVQACTFNTFW